jgi:hypothetical protein
MVSASAWVGSGGDNHDVAGSVSGEQAVQCEKADDVHAPGDCAQRKRQPHGGNRIADWQSDWTGMMRM